ERGLGLDCRRYRTVGEFVGRDFNRRRRAQRQTSRKAVVDCRDEIEIDRASGRYIIEQFCRRNVEIGGVRIAIDGDIREVCVGIGVSFVAPRKKEVLPIRSYLIVVAVKAERQSGFRRPGSRIVIGDAKVLSERSAAVRRDRHIHIGQAVVGRIVAAVGPFYPDRSVLSSGYRRQNLSRGRLIVVEPHGVTEGVAAVRRAYVKDVAAISSHAIGNCIEDDMHGSVLVYDEARKTVAPISIAAGYETVREWRKKHGGGLRSGKCFSAVDRFDYNDHTFRIW